MEEAKEAAERAQAAAANETTASKRTGKKKGAKGKKGASQDAAELSSSAIAAGRKTSTAAAAESELDAGEERLVGELELSSEGDGYGAAAAGASASGGVTITAPADLLAELARLVKAQAPPPVPAASAATSGLKQEVKTPAAHVHQTTPMMGDLLGALMSERAAAPMPRLSSSGLAGGAAVAPLVVSTAEHGLIAGALKQPISAHMRSPTGTNTRSPAAITPGVVLRSPHHMSSAAASASALHSLHAASTTSVHATSSVGGAVAVGAVGEGAPVDDGMFHALKDLLPNDLLSSELKDLHILPHEADSIFDLGFDTLGIEELGKDPRGSLFYLLKILSYLGPNPFFGPLNKYLEYFYVLEI